MRTDGRGIWRGWATAALAVLGPSACTGEQRATPRVATPETLTAMRWVEVSATLDPSTMPVYQGDAPLKFEFLKDMLRGDVLILSAYSMGAHSGTHIDAPMHFVLGGA